MKEKSLKIIKYTSLFCTIFTYIILCKCLNIVYYNTLSLLIFVAIFILVSKTNFKEDKKILFFSLILSIIFSIIQVVGNEVYIHAESSSVNILAEIVKLKNFIKFIGIANLFFIILMHIIPFILKLKIIDKKDNKLTSNKIFGISFIVIFLVYLIYFLAFYPGFLSPDSLSTVHQIINEAYSDHHPVLFSFFVYIFYNLGSLFGGPNISVAFFSFAQMTVMALIFSYVIKFLHKRNVSKWILLIILLYYALAPMHGFYSITMWKDVLFAGFSCLFLVSLIKIVEEKGNISKNTFISFITTSLLFIFFRNNAIYIYILLLIAFLIYLKKKDHIISFACFLIIILYFIIKGPVFDYFDVKRSSSTEYLAVPLWQISRVVYKDGNISNYEKNKISELMPIDLIKESYNYQVIDSIKFNESFNIEVFNDDKVGFFKLWFSLLFKNPQIYIESFLASNIGYWYPNVVYWANADDITDNELGIDEDPIIEGLIRKGLLYLTRRDIPISLIWSIGLMFNLLLFMFVLSILNKRKRFVFLLPLFLWITMLMASPVMGEFRYIYGIYCYAPILFCCIYIKSLKIKK